MSARAEQAEAGSWWRDAVIYQVYPRSWADADGDGIGDLRGITSRLEHLVDLGVDAVWLSPFYPSPQHDHGYDVSDYRDVDPRFGTLDDFDVLLSTAHRLGLKVIVDLVPNHSSSEHPWFQQALASGPGSRERARYVFRDGRGDDGELPPNNWQSSFGGSAWERVVEADGAPGQWYLHLFDVTQPDWDWTNQEVRDELADVLRFWLDRGVDGFRIDVAHGLSKAEGLPDAPEGHDANAHPTTLMPMWDQPGVHEVYRSWRQLTDAYSATGHERILVAEAWVLPAEALAQYVRPDELHQSFNFMFLMTPWIADELRVTIRESLHHAESVGAPQTWVLSNHDVVRHASRLGYPQQAGLSNPDGIGPDDPQPDLALGLRRARAATALMLALPGSAYLYQGEELGLPEVTTLADAELQDPVWERSGHMRRGRDGCRVPIPWEHDAPAYGFSPTGRAWLPQPEAFAWLARDQQRGVEGSTLELYRALLTVRRERRLGNGRLEWIDPADFGADPDEVLVFAVGRPGGPTVTVLANLGAAPVVLPDWVEVLVASEALRGREVPGDVTVWVA